MIVESINPYNNEVVAEQHKATQKDIDWAIKKAEFTYQDWRRSEFKLRSDLMMKAAERLRSNKERYAKMMTLEMGKAIKEAKSEVEKCAWVCEYYAENAEQILAKKMIESGAQKSYVRYDPIGCVLAVMPWNFPFWQVFRFAAPTLMAGNVGILKHASNVFGSGKMIEEVFIEAGFPEGTFKNLVIGSDKIPHLIEQDIVRAVTLTGSEPAGSSVSKQAGKLIKNSLLELGGSDPFIVLKDADISKAAKTAVDSRMLNAGQSCIAAKRFIVEKSVLADFTEQFVNYMKSKKFGNPLEESTDFGPMAKPKLAEELMEQTQKSIDNGAKVLLEGKQEGAHFQPYVLGNVKPGMPAFDEETFGPVAAIISAEDENDAIMLANKSEFGLGSSLWTENLEKAERLASEIESGSVFINSMMKSDPRLPFGGIKKSGFGRELSENGIKEFMNAKTVSIGEK